MLERHQRRWTDAEYKDIKELLRLGISRAEVAKRYGTTVTSLRRLVQRRDYKNGEHTRKRSFWDVPDRHETMVNMWKSGSGALEIAKVLGTTRATVVGRLRRSGLMEKPRAEATVLIKNKMRLSNLRSAVYAAKVKKQELAAVGSETSGRPWTERTHSQCAFIVSGLGADSIACCAPRVEGLRFPYCEEHAKLMFVEKENGRRD
jgi:hypothetical protein